jgi:hypothetical protein
MFLGPQWVGRVIGNWMLFFFCPNASRREPPFPVDESYWRGRRDQGLIQLHSARMFDSDPN